MASVASVAVPSGGNWRTSFAHLQSVARCLECGVLVIDAAGKVALCSPSMAATFGLSVDEVVAMGPVAFIDHVASLVHEPPPVIAERRLLPTDGHITCEEFEVERPSRSVVRWVARQVTEPEPAQIVVLTDITTEVDLAAAYERLAITDMLTGLANRRGGEQQLRREMSRARRYGGALCFVLLDVDHFKKVNDQHGHNVGDEVLRRIAGTLTQVLRESDMAARWGGEEFLVVLPSTMLEGARLCAERIRHAVERLSVPALPPVTISAGCAQLEPNEDLRTVLARADERLYEAKAGGRNRVR